MTFYYSAETNVNTGNAWSEMDLNDIHDFAPVMTLKQLADYLCRSEHEVAAKLEELKLPSSSLCERP